MFRRNSASSSATEEHTHEYIYWTSRLRSRSFPKREECKHEGVRLHPSDFDNFGIKKPLELEYAEISLSLDHRNKPFVLLVHLISEISNPCSFSQLGSGLSICPTSVPAFFPCPVLSLMPMIR